MNKKYVHGYSERESERLRDQADALTDLLHGDTRYPARASVLEAGCGVGAQSVILAKNSPQAEITSIDISDVSLAEARRRVKESGSSNVSFHQADIFNLSYADNTFDHVFVCFVLEHLREPQRALECLKRVLKPGGTITVIEGDHGSTYFHPDNADASAAVRCLVEIQKSMGGDANIGRQVFPLLSAAGFTSVQVSPRMVYVDGSTPKRADGFTRKTFAAMVEGVRDQALSMHLMNAEAWERGIRALYRAAEQDGVFCYTFFKGIGIK